MIRFEGSTGVVDGERIDGHQGWPEPSGRNRPGNGGSLRSTDWLRSPTVSSLVRSGLTRTWCSRPRWVGLHRTRDPAMHKLIKAHNEPMTPGPSETMPPEPAARRFAISR